MMRGSEGDTMYDPNCEFCRIIRRQDPARIVWESDVALAFFPLKPAALGHTLVVPKEHVIDLWAVNETLAAQLMVTAVRVARAIRTALNPDGMNLISSVGEAASQTVFHLHLHLVPRWKTDHIPSIWPPPEPWPEAVEDDVAQLIRDECYGV
jgi:histidine triad (HIT) family protein